MGDVASRQNKSISLESIHRDFLNPSSFDSLFNGPLSARASSRGLAWKGFLVEESLLQPCEMAEGAADRYYLALWATRGVGEHAMQRGMFRPFIKDAGVLTFVPPGSIPAARTANPNQLICCSVDRSIIDAVEMESDKRPGERAIARTGFTDPAISRLIELLLLEAREGGESGLLYWEHLIHALATRILFLGHNVNRFLREPISPLPRSVMQRVVESIRAHRGNVNLETLARECGYSRRHFLRMFRASTGLSPHNYALQLKIQQAQEMMKERSRPLIEIAQSCGFSSHSHMSRVFRQVFGRSPTEYRRMI